MFPLGPVHYIEVSGNRDADQRRNLATIMEEVSGFASIPSMLTVAEAECEAALASIAGVSATGPSTALIGHGVLQAFGRRGGLRIKNKDGLDITEKARQDWPGGPVAFDGFSRDADMKLSRSVLTGPSPEDVPKMIAMGWDPRAAKTVAGKRAQQQQELGQRLDFVGEFRRGRIRDLVSAQYLAGEIFETFSRIAQLYPGAIDAMTSDLDIARRLTDSMPSADVYVSLVVAAQRNPQTVWTPNSILDIDALGVAAAYCDVVLTERHFGTQLAVNGLASRLDTRVFVSPEDLTALLSGSRSG